MIKQKRNYTRKHNANKIKSYNHYLTDRQNKYLLTKRFLDIFLSTWAIVCLSPLFIILSIIIKIDSPGPILFKQKRVGKNKKLFEILKFRTMRIDAPKDTPTHMLSNPEQYITKSGKFMRKTSLDELPQIFNIFMGQMSIIGPRPALWNQIDLIKERDKYGANSITPGLTGWAQINGRDELEIPIKAKLDGDYVHKMGFLMDAKCFLGTIGAVLMHDGLVEGGTGEIHKGNKSTNNNIISRANNKQKKIDINGKKILFFSPAFFNYENLITAKMEEMGAIVDMYDVRSVTTSKERALLKVFPQLFQRKSLNYYEKIISANRTKDYDYILIIKCDMTPEKILKKLKDIYPHAKLCLNLWDSIENIPGILKKLKYFDTIHSFDMKDCNEYPILKFRPLFYADQFTGKLVKEKEYKYDISFLGTIHSDRYKIIKQVKEIVQKNNLKSYWFCYLQSKFIYYFYKLTKKEFFDTNKSMFSFVKKSSEEIAIIENASKIILDIQHPKQTGLTIRTIEMLGMQKKLITTNTSIKYYDFYNPNNISIINRNDIHIDMSFFEKVYEPIDQDIYNKYSLESWIKEVLS